MDDDAGNENAVAGFAGMISGARAGVRFSTRRHARQRSASDSCVGGRFLVEMEKLEGRIRRPGGKRPCETGRRCKLHMGRRGGCIGGVTKSGFGEI
jgi:hypothetical protein